jgi:hypothetical protein
MQGVTFLMKFNAWVVRLPKKKKALLAQALL